MRTCRGADRPPGQRRAPQNDAERARPATSSGPEGLDDAGSPLGLRLIDWPKAELVERLFETPGDKSAPKRYFDLATRSCCPRFAGSGGPRWGSNHNPRINRTSGRARAHLRNTAQRRPSARKSVAVRRQAYGSSHVLNGRLLDHCAAPPQGHTRLGLTRRRVGDGVQVD
jgi:hypothetical protein